MKKRGKSNQLSFFKPGESQFGGALLKGNPKEKRPLSRKKAVHLVLKSKRAFGTQSMLAKDHVKKIDLLVRRQAATFGVRIYHFVNVGNHLHLVVRLHDRRAYMSFIRSISGLIARQVLGAERGPSRKKAYETDRLPAGHARPDPTTETIRFWIARPFTRLVNWGSDYRRLGAYMKKNQSQAEGYPRHIGDRRGVAVFGFDPKADLEVKRSIPLQNSA